MPRNLWQVVVAEAIGTFALVFVGVLAISALGIVSPADGAPSLVGVAFAHGLTIAVMVAALGAVSGGHFNPAITFGFVVTGRLKPLGGLVYWAAQLGGAALAALLLVATLGATPVSLGTPDVAPAVGFWTAVVLEIVATFFLVLVVFGTAVDERAPTAVFPLAIGLTIVLDILAIGPLTGGAMNPARTFGPALASAHWTNHLVYWIGPLIGGALAGAIYDFFLMERAILVPKEYRVGPTEEEERRAA